MRVFGYNFFSYKTKFEASKIQTTQYLALEFFDVEGFQLSFVVVSIWTTTSTVMVFIPMHKSEYGKKTWSSENVDLSIVLIRAAKKWTLSCKTTLVVESSRATTLFISSDKDKSWWLGLYGIPLTIVGRVE